MHAVAKNIVHDTLTEFQRVNLLPALRGRNYLAMNAVAGPCGAVGAGFDLKTGPSFPYCIAAYPYVTVAPGADLAQRILAASGATDLVEIVPFLQNLEPAVSIFKCKQHIMKYLVSNEIRHSSSSSIFLVSYHDDYFSCRAFQR